MATIEINSYNYKSFIGLDIIAFSYSEPGAMGKRGTVYATTSDNRTLYMNYIEGDISINEIQAVCPALKECREKRFVFAPEGWDLKRLGFGNFLVVSNRILSKFDLLTRSFDQVELYKSWRDIINNIIQ